MFKRNLIIGAILIFATFLVSFVIAKTESNAPAPTYRKLKFEEIDKNGKGYITEGDFFDSVDEQWDSIKKSDSDYITKKEFLESVGSKKAKSAEKVFKGFDANNDGKITKKEFKLKKEVEFAKIKKSDDGKVLKEDYESTKTRKKKKETLKKADAVKK